MVTLIVGVCNYSMFCCTLLYVHPSIAIILMGKRELVALLNLSSWCLVMVKRLFLAVPQGCLRFVILLFHDHTQLLFFIPDINHISLISFEMVEDYKNIPISTNNTNYFESMRLFKFLGIGTYSLRSRSSINFFAIDLSILRIMSLRTQ